jgi:dTDP-4-dehydrorhamnose 3,5-epimerase
MRRIDTAIPGVFLVEPVVHGDHRGFFMESYHRDRFAELGIDCEFVQDNHSRSRAGVLRGLHYQLGQPPAGFGHGFLVLTEVAEFQYKCSDFYAPAEERGVRWDDPTLAIEWPTAGLDPILSDRDLAWPHLADAAPDDLPEFGS